uniref:Uncharacterized protein n=1 Tax=Podoviridae sp. ctIlO27 TaxID=2825238 RepID=A0A8S5PZ16_9CAUD|nr:MAG TPA: hypothetical protein [Podoviridae sp. ctIlO27]
MASYPYTVLENTFNRRTTPPDSMAFFVPFCQSRHFFWL